MKKETRAKHTLYGIVTSAWLLENHSLDDAEALIRLLSLEAEPQVLPSYPASVSADGSREPRLFSFLIFEDNELFILTLFLSQAEISKSRM